MNITAFDWLILEVKTKNWLITHVNAKKLGSFSYFNFFQFGVVNLNNEQSTSIEIYGHMI